MSTLETLFFAPYVTNIYPFSVEMATWLFSTILNAKFGWLPYRKSGNPSTGVMYCTSDSRGLNVPWVQNYKYRYQYLPVFSYQQQVSLQNNYKELKTCFQEMINIISSTSHQNFSIPYSSGKIGEMTTQSESQYTQDFQELGATFLFLAHCIKVHIKCLLSFNLNSL